MPTSPSSIAPASVHLTGSGKLKVSNCRLSWSVPNERPVNINLRRLRTLFIYDKVSMSDNVMRLLFEHAVEVAWLTPGGRKCRGRIVTNERAGANLRMLQHQVFQSEKRIDIARDFVMSKLESQLIALRRHQRNGQAFGETMNRIAGLQEKTQTVQNVATLRGLEGTATRLWFSTLPQLLNAPWKFPGRTKRPPTDPVNALLSLGYTWLITRITAQLEARGFEVQCGALHEFRSGRPALACDVIEPLRIPIVDRWVFRLCNRHTLKLEDFVTTEQQGTRLVPERFRELLKVWDEHLIKFNFQATIDAQLRELEMTIRDHAK